MINIYSLLHKRAGRGRGSIRLKRLRQLIFMIILGDAYKFIQLGPDVTHSKTKDIKSNLKKCMCRFLKDKFHPVNIDEAVSPLGSILPGVFALPKTHKIVCQHNATGT